MFAPVLLLRRNVEDRPFTGRTIVAGDRLQTAPQTSSVSRRERVIRGALLTLRERRSIDSLRPGATSWYNQPRPLTPWPAHGVPGGLTLAPSGNLVYRAHQSQRNDTMHRLLVLAVITALANCAAPYKTASSLGADINLAPVEKSEPAPFTSPIDYRVSPDSRERLCGDSQLANRDNSYGMLTKASTSYYCF